MPAVNWNVFEKLPGAPDRNFETLCRALVRRHYGRFGDFRALANQPGVEFHLKLHSDCSLGESGRWYGWQCRWYDHPRGRALGSARRTKIAGAMAKSEAVLPGLTDWVLWTRWPLTESDQKWLDKCKTRMRLHQWTSLEVEEHLSGDAEIFRGTYFGELVLTSSVLAALHEKAVAPIGRRWHPEVHQRINVERQLRRILGESEYWDDLQKLADQLDKDTAAIQADTRQVDSELSDATADVARCSHGAASLLKAAHAALLGGDFDIVRECIFNQSFIPPARATALPHQLRARRGRAALSVTNALGDIRSAGSLLKELIACLGKRLVAVLADAGCGKTHRNCLAPTLVIRR
ncbi:MAG: hypothetical protein HY040_27635 [Planctomycetes bacterium]|nr:hypothetical protein [Planctomycetota bacterium]